VIYDRTVGGEHGTPTLEKIKEKIFNSARITEGLIILIISKLYVGNLYLELLNIVSGEIFTFSY
jgi:hypothetical protein